MGPLNLEKSKQVILDIKKRSKLEGKKAAVTVVLDRSGSMSSMFQDGSVATVLARLLPLAMAFDDDGTLDFVTFSSNAQEQPGLKAHMYENNSIKDIVNRIGTSGSTVYSAALKEVLSYDYEIKKTGKLLGIFGGSETLQRKESAKYSRFVIFLTDGDCDFDDVKDSQEEMTRQSKETDIFYVFVGIGNSKFELLKKWASVYPNCNFLPVDMSDLLNASDETLYSTLLTNFNPR